MGGIVGSLCGTVAGYLNRNGTIWLNVYHSLKNEFSKGKNIYLLNISPHCFYLPNLTLQELSLWPQLLSPPTMSCRDIHATNAFSFIIALLCVGGIAVAALIPQWRITTLVTFNRNAKNISVYDGLWAKCVKRDDNSGCYYYDTEVWLRLIYFFSPPLLSKTVLIEI